MIDTAKTELESNEIELYNRLCHMKMSVMAATYREQVLNPNSDLVSFKDRFAEIVNSEWDTRYTKKLKTLIAKAHLRYPDAELDESIYLPERKLDTNTIEQLNKCEWIDEGKNLIVTGSTSSGKTYIINAICISAMRRFKTVSYMRANTLMSNLERASIQDGYIEMLNSLSKVDLLVIDDFGLMDLDLNKCRDLFEVIDARDGRKSTVVISQFPVKAWFDMFSDNTYADACLARITDRRHTYRLEMNGISMRERI